MIGDPTIADAVLDRLVHNAHRLQLKREPLRKQAAKAIMLDAEAIALPHAYVDDDHGRDRWNRWLLWIGNGGWLPLESPAAIIGIRTMLSSRPTMVVFGPKACKRIGS